MCLGRTCRTTDAVTTGTAAKQNDNISGSEVSLCTARLGAAPSTAPISMRFAT